MKLRLLLLLATLVVLGGCVPAVDGSGNPLPRSAPVSASLNVQRVVDEEAGVACWVWTSALYETGGISCLPLSETDLDY